MKSGKSGMGSRRVSLQSLWLRLLRNLKKFRFFLQAPMMPLKLSEEGLCFSTQFLPLDLSQKLAHCGFLGLNLAHLGLKSGNHFVNFRLFIDEKIPLADFEGS